MSSNTRPPHPFGTHKERRERYQMLVKAYGKARADELSQSTRTPPERKASKRRAAFTYRAARVNAAREPRACDLLKAERLRRGLTRRQADWVREKLGNALYLAGAPAPIKPSPQPAIR